MRIFLHGLGQSNKSWSKVLSAIDDAESLCIDLPDLVKDKRTTYENIYEAFSDICNRSTGKIDLCGLSLGGILALNYAIDHTEKVNTLVIIAAQYKMPRLLLFFQNVLFKFMPGKMFLEFGLQKEDYIQLCKSMMRLDFSKSIHCICCPTLVVYGERDKANKKAAVELAKYIKRGKLKEIKNSGHEVNIDAPEALGEELNLFYKEVETTY